jgi:hypothetical protein
LADTEKLSLYRAISEGGYEASVVASYAISFPFYERVVLRRLQAAGCRHNILVADGGRCGEALSSAPTRPQFSGVDYLLLPVRSAASFHPKFVMLLGKHGARLVVGSHNVTLAGFGLNREIATSFICSANEPSASFARNVWRFVRAWTEEFPDKIREVVAATERMAPWLSGEDHPTTSPLVVGSEPTGESLWDRVRPLLATRVNRVTVVSPYFDAKLTFIKRLESELKPKESVVAVHPMFSELPSNAQALSPQTRFVDVSGLGEGWADRYLHAKLYCFELANGRSIVVLGSANASAPAWLGGANRNAELVVVHQDAEQLWKRIGLHRITAAPILGKSAWAALKERAAKKEKIEGWPAPSLAVVTSDGFIVDEAFVGGVKAERIQVVTDNTATAAIQAVKQTRGGVLCVCASAEIRDSATRLEVAPASGSKRIALVQHVSELLDRAAGSVRQAFRRALAMEADPEQLTALMKVVEKAIFDEPVMLDDPKNRSRAKPAKGTATPEADEPETLVISAKDTVKARRRRRLSASSDLAVIIDALIYRLGQGLYAKRETDSPDSVAPSEETLRNEDVEPPEIDGHMLAKACRGKVNRLFRRMIAQCELAVKRGRDATTPLVQMAAVLGVVRHLRSRQATFAWLPKGERLVDQGHEWDFFKEASRCLYASACGLAAKALAEHDGREFDELTAVRGLLTWLALDCDLDTRTALDDVVDEPAIARDNLIGVAYLMPVITQCTEDAFALDVLNTIAAEQPDSMKRTAAYHVEWARRITKAIQDHQPAAGPIALGDLVLPVKVSANWPLVVVDAQYNKTGIVDLDTGEPKYFGAGYVARLQGLPTKH